MKNKKNASLLLVLMLLLAFTSCSSHKSVTANKTEKTSKKSIVRDGSSFEKAIIVKSIPEEYEYVKKNCNNCTNLVKQVLSNNDGVPYDILYFKTDSGKEVKYYFDISSFFGKW